MTWVFVATIAAGSLGAVHYVVWHVLLGRPFDELPPASLPAASSREDAPSSIRDTGEADV